MATPKGRMNKRKDRPEKSHRGRIEMDRPEDLRRLLDDLEWSPWELAYEIGVSYHTVLHWLKGERRIPEPVKILLRQIRYNLDVHGQKGLGLPPEVMPSRR